MSAQIEPVNAFAKRLAELSLQEAKHRAKRQH